MVDSDTIYDYSRKINSAREKILTSKDSKIVVEFIAALEERGRSKGRIVYYLGRIPKIVHWFDSHNVSLGLATKEDCRACMRELIQSCDYAGETRSHFAKTGEIGEKRDGNDYVPEVLWIRPSVYLRQGRKGIVNLMGYDLIIPS